MAKEIIITVPLDDPENVKIEAFGFQGGACKKATQPIIDGFGKEIISDTAKPEMALVPNQTIQQQLKAKG